MGRDKVPKAAPAAVETNDCLVIGLSGKPQRPPRGKSDTNVIINYLYCDNVAMLNKYTS